MFEIIKLMKPFFTDPDRDYGVREYSKLLAITPATASVKLKKLEKMELISSRNERVYLFFRANLENESYKDLKVFYNIRIIKESGLLDELNRHYIKPTIVLFGSASLGMDVKDSDMDILVISEKKTVPDLKKYGKKIDRELQLFAVTSINDLKNKHLINNMLNGITIQGSVQWT